MSTPKLFPNQSKPTTVHRARHMHTSIIPIHSLMQYIHNGCNTAISEVSRFLALSIAKEFRSIERERERGGGWKAFTHFSDQLELFERVS